MNFKVLQHTKCFQVRLLILNETLCKMMITNAQSQRTKCEAQQSTLPPFANDKSVYKTSIPAISLTVDKINLNAENPIPRHKNVSAPISNAKSNGKFKR